MSTAEDEITDDNGGPIISERVQVKTKHSFLINIEAMLFFILSHVNILYGYINTLSYHCPSTCTVCLTFNLAL